MLLKNDFTSFNNIATISTSIRLDTSLDYFEIEDVSRVITIVATGTGTGKYKNAMGNDVVIIDYDGFLTSLPHSFQQGKKRCDVIVYTTNYSHFLLNELKNRNPSEGVLTKATEQMLATLTEIMRIPSIVAFISNFQDKKCCYSNKQAIPPSQNVNATSAFNRINTLSTNGLKLTNSDIEAFGFELYEFSGNQVIDLS